MIKRTEYDAADYAAQGVDNLPLESEIRKTLVIGGIFSTNGRYWFVSFGGRTRAAGLSQIDAAREFCAIK